MNKHLRQLIDLSKIDQQIDAFEPKIEAIKKELNLILKQKADILKEIDNLNDDIVEVKNKKSKNEAHLNELSLKFEDINKKTAQVKNEREAKALTLEEEIAKEQLSFANEEIARFDKIIENEESKIAELKAKSKELEEKSKEKEISVNKSLVELERERSEISNSKNELKSKMDQKIIIFYEKIRRWAGNSTVVEVRKQACYGCFMKISDRVYSEVIKAEDITTCPHCGRILYNQAQEA